MKVYVAGKSLNRAKLVMDALRQAGHEITYDWTKDYSEDSPEQKAHDEREGVMGADLLVYLWEEDQESARYEAGMAMGLKKHIIVSGKNDAFFFTLSNIYCVGADGEIVGMIDRI